jgi:LacI family transcriptional regulator
MKRVTIKDIARKADVSVATVSYVINKTRWVSPKLTSRVNAAIAELSYSPNAVAQSLRQSRTKTIGLIVPDNSNPFFAEIAKGVEDAGFDAGYSVILCNSNAMIERELAYVELLKSKRVDGIIFIGTTTETKHLRPLIRSGIPAVIFYRQSGNLDVDTFCIDNERAGFLATSHLIELGHREIACIQPASAATASGHRVEGFLRAMQEHGLQCNEQLMPRGDNLLPGGWRAANELIKSQIPFSAVFACNDAMAVGCIRAFCEAGYRVPEDISIVGVDDIQLASFCEPTLTTITQPKDQAGRQAVEMLLDRITGRHSDGPREIELEIKLIVRNSSKPPSG